MDHIVLSVLAEALEKCLEKGVAFTVVFSAGFGEVGTPEGDEAEARLAELASGPMRVIGPNTNLNIFEPWPSGFPGKQLVIVTQSGYQGRVPVMEIMRITPEVADLVSRVAGTAELRRAAVGGGMRMLVSSAIGRVEASETTLEEMERVIGEPDDPESLATPGGAEAEAGAPGKIVPLTPTSARILVVDDDPVHRSAAHRALESQGFRVQEASSGTNALEQVLAGDPYALVLLDLRMPGMGGREVVTCLRAMPKTSRVPIIVATSEEDEQLEVELMEAGADDYIRKPLEPTRLVARVRSALRRAAA